MKSRDEIGVLFEATSVAQETISDAIHLDRVRRLVQRLEAAGPEFVADRVRARHRPRSAVPAP